MTERDSTSKDRGETTSNGVKVVLVEETLCTREEIGELAAKLEKVEHKTLMAIGALESITPGETETLELSELLAYAIEALR